jgi:plastocyanin
MKKLFISKKRLLMASVFLFTLLCISNSCTKKTMSDMYNTGDPSSITGGSGGPGLNEVFIQGMAFNPATITVAPGTTITWTNKDGVAHTVTSNTGLFESGSFSANGTYSHLFGTPGTYLYHCTIHPSMTGTIVVN